MNSDQNKIRNFCIIAHIDHGKSTLADRLLELTGTVSKREMREQMLDTMDLERERGITIKLQPVRMEYKDYTLNLIDTPGHVDFAYEVSRSLAAVEGALLLVDASQGVQAQTIGNLYFALEQNLTVIPVVNKIDLPNARVEDAKAELVKLLGCAPEEVLLASGKTGAGVPEIIQAVIARIPPPAGRASAPARALIFDSTYDEFQGVIAYVRMVDGALRRGEQVETIATRAQGIALEVGSFRPQRVTRDSLQTGEIGYIVTGLKDIDEVRVGDTIAPHGSAASGVAPLPGYKEVRPMVYAGIFPKSADLYEKLRECMGKLKLNDAALMFEPERSPALGFGFRCGLLGLLHLEIVSERLRREYDIPVVTTTPSVAYRVTQTDGATSVIKSPSDLPNPTKIAKIEEPWVRVDVVVPEAFLGGVMRLAGEKHGIYKNTEYLSADSAGRRAILHYDMPLAMILVDFYDRLKSASSGYGSFSYEFLDYREADVVRLDIYVAEEIVEALATIVYSDAAADSGRKIASLLKETLSRQMFEVKIQAAVGGKIVASERLSAMRKDVTGYLYGGDVTRKRKLLEKQKKGKKKMMARGRVEIPPEAYLAVLKRK
ncbi:MAG: translation elongation factor 4 [Patescibacteria group bacterium]